MFCGNCGKPVKEGKAFCIHCGNKIGAKEPARQAYAAVGRGTVWPAALLSLVSYLKPGLKPSRKIRIDAKQSVGVAIVLVLIIIGGSFVWWTLRSTTGQTIDEPLAGKMVFVKGGTFWMGCTKEDAERNTKPWLYPNSSRSATNCYDIDTPRHEVTLSDFYIGKYEVTQAQWKAVMGANNNPSELKGDDLPVENVSWNDVQAFINELNVRTKKIWRLPTEAEWEYASKGGDKSHGYRYSGSNNLTEVALVGTGRTLPVGRMKANELGIHDMNGNVEEWVSDYLAPYSPQPQTNPQGPQRGNFSSRSVRGWGYYLVIQGYTPLRGGANPDERKGYRGFRLARGSY